MIKEAIEKVLDLAAPTITEIGGITYSDRNIEQVLEPRPSRLLVRTLAGLVDYLESDLDAVNNEDTLMLHVVSPTEVQAFTSLCTPEMRRNHYISARAELPQFKFGQYMSIEHFIIGLQTFFVQDEAVVDILKVVGNITDESKATMMDDGVSQSVEAKVGIVRRTDVVVPRIVLLRPYRTFLEIDQPQGAFILRIKSGSQEGTQPSVALFEADAGAWQLTAMERVGIWLEDKLGRSLTIIA